ncbi:MAG: hypothetical protein GC172_03575 [Phycisphaera sp.]|nr:hypothetical protein [Phycisphaera sp.]
MSAAIELSPELDDAVRAQLRPGERIAYARSPFSEHDDGSLVARLTAGLVVVGPLVALGSLGEFVVEASSVVSGTKDAGWDLVRSLVTLVVVAFTVWREVDRYRHARRAARNSAAVVTTERILMVSTWPTPAVSAWEARDIVQCVRTPYNARCGHVRFLSGLYSHEGNALMRVPLPEACASAIGALIEARDAMLRENLVADAGARGASILRT